MLRFRHGSQEKCWNSIFLAKVGEEFQPGFPRHHDVDNQQIENKAIKNFPCIAGRTDIGYAKSAFLEKPPQQKPKPFVIVDNQYMLFARQTALRH